MDSMNTTIRGANTPFLYFGSWKTTFPWHTDDHELYSINFLHSGASKFWYSIPPKHAKQFEMLAGRLFPDMFNRCPAYMRHKRTLIGIHVNRIEQREGQFIVTFPRGYHAGFNTDYNIAESTNFATNRWVDIAKNALLCTCNNDSKRINDRLHAFVSEYESSKQYKQWKTKSKKGKKRAKKTSHPSADCSKKAKKSRQTGSLGDYDYHDMDTDKASSLPSCSRIPDVPIDIDYRLTTSAATIAKRVETSEMDLNNPRRFGTLAKPLENMWTFKIRVRSGTGTRSENGSDRAALLPVSIFHFNGTLHQNIGQKRGRRSHWKESTKSRHRNELPQVWIEFGNAGW